MFYQSVGLFLYIICSSLASFVTFLPSSNFNSLNNFKDGKLPCSRETVVFPKTLMTAIKLESKTSVKGFILPKDGDIILDNGMVMFGADKDDVNCTQERNIDYLEKAVLKWSQPDIWSSPTFNDATPDAERIPCFDDIVVFPTKAVFTLIFPNQLQYVAAIKIGNHTCSTLESCMENLSGSNEAHMFIYNNFWAFGLMFQQQKCESKAGCPCQKHPLKINCESKYCSVPKCVDPIKPEGHCCKICGGVINFRIDESFDIMVFKEQIEQIIKSYGPDSLIYHVGRLGSNNVQLVIVDKAEYSGLSAEVVNIIDHKMKKQWIKRAKFVNISGSPLEKSGLGGKIFVSVFFLVVLIMGGIYVYYYKLSGVPDFRIPSLHRSAPGVFSRFQSRTDSVVCLTRRDSETAIGGSAQTAFRNPLYDSTRQREEIEESGVDE